MQPWHTPFPIWNQCVVPCPVASWPAYRFLKRQVRESGIPISFRIFQFFVIHTKHFPKPNLNQKEVMVTTAFWIPAKPLYLRSILSQSMRFTENCNTYSWALINSKGPILLHNSACPHFIQPMLQKLNKLGYEVLPHPPHSPDLSPINYHFFKHLNNFLQGKCFHN